MIDTETLVCEDIKRRQQVGLNKYGVSVAASDKELLYWMQHLYEELLDASVYLKRSMQAMQQEAAYASINAVMRSWVEEAVDNNGDNNS